MELIDGRYTAHHVLEAGFVGLVVWHVLDGRGAARTFSYAVGQSLDGDLLGVADVDDFADGMMGVHEADETFDGVAHIAEAAGLLSAAVDADGGVVQGGLDEIGEDHSIAASFAGANGVEQTDRNDREAFFLPVRKDGEIL